MKTPPGYGIGRLEGGLHDDWNSDDRAILIVP
jgi:hypothetical protein